MINEKLIVAGFGGQGVLMIGKMVALSAMENGMEVSWLPAYGSEMRGGTATCSVSVSDEPVDSPMILKPTSLIVMNLPSLLKFEDRLAAGGIMIINSSLVHQEPTRTDIKAFKIPFNDLAMEAGNERGMNMLVAGVYAAITEKISLQNLYDAVDHTFVDAKAKFAQGNKEMIKCGYDYATKSFKM
ncbi:2-oxoacid:acceptor oxidoreductase family protein [Oscillibacter sp. GMB15532]|uniref:2-oxoacid:acceptor oxidoreductase family protein n=1 Tax=Oscillibacter sp. GMB15532 TaxID=3230022 RepID=UPI0034DE1432